ncbi:MAG: hydrogenase nickel incorporation protein HypB [bacterium]
MSLITIERKVLDMNDKIANENRLMFKEKKIFAVNILSSPGAGKTSLIEKTIEETRKKFSTVVIEGDIETSIDAERIGALEVPVVQIVTNGACHLDADLVKDAFKNLGDTKAQLLIIENVGNLVCPAEFDIGENIKVVVLSVTEGEDKPHKYPLVFRESEAMLINKTDLLPHLKFSIEQLKKNALGINPKLKIFETSCYTGEGIAEWCTWLEKRMYS